MNDDKLEQLKVRRNVVTGKPDIRCFVEDMNAYLTVSDVAQKKKKDYNLFGNFTFHFMSFVAFCFVFVT